VNPLYEFIVTCGESIKSVPLRPTVVENAGFALAESFRAARNAHWPQRCKSSATRRRSAEGCDPP
jgi:hypothetical protein